MRLGSGEPSAPHRQSLPRWGSAAFRRDPPTYAREPHHCGLIRYELRSEVVLNGLAGRADLGHGPDQPCASCVEVSDPGHGAAAAKGRL